MFNKILLCLMISFSAFADTNNLSWTAPTKRVDGTVLAPTEIKEYEIRYGSSPTDLKIHFCTKN